MDFEKPQDYVDTLKRLDGCLRELAGDGFTRGDHIIDQGDSIYISTEMGSAVELLFKDEDGDD